MPSAEKCRRPEFLMNEKINFPLVSVCVVSYNSEQTICDTLQSIYNQTYKNIELILCDDSSKDNTIKLAKEWIKNKEERFSKVKISVSERNRGVSFNCNVGAKIASGEYVKFFGADDLMLASYVSDCVLFMEEHSSNVLFTKLQAFLENNTNDFYEQKEDYDFFKLSSDEQFRYIVKIGIPYIPTPSCIYRKKILEELNYFDEEIPMWEDGPMYFRLAQNHIKMDLLEKTLILYRIRKNSLSNGRPVSHLLSISKYFFKYAFKYEIRSVPIKAIYHALKFTIYKFAYIKPIYRLLSLKK